MTDGSLYTITGYMYSIAAIPSGATSIDSVTGTTVTPGIEVGFSSSDTSITKISYNRIDKEGFVVYPVLGMESCNPMPTISYDYAYAVYNGKPVFFNGSNWVYIVTGASI